MKNPLQLAALALVGGAFFGGLALIIHWRVQRGDVFPEYSSLRADESGTRALRDALATLPGMTASARTASLASLAASPQRTLILAGMRRGPWQDIQVDAVDALDAAVKAGSRLVIGFAPDPPPPEADGKPKAKEEAPQDKNAPAEKPPGIPAGPAVIRMRWGIALAKADPKAREVKEVRRSGDDASGLPRTLPWNGAMAFETADGAGWRPLFAGGGRPAILERRLGAGTIVVLGDSHLLTNEALRRNRETGLLSWLVGPNGEVVFDETHLGITHQSGPAALARRYRLTAAAVTLILVAMLYAWQQAAVFVRPEEESRDLILRYHPAAALQALLKRSVPPSELSAACVAEWRRTARQQDWPRVEEAVRGAPDPVSAYNRATRALRHRNPPP